MRSQCFDQRMGDYQAHGAEIAASERQWTADGVRVKWMFSTRRTQYIPLKNIAPDVDDPGVGMPISVG